MRSPTRRSGSSSPPTPASSNARVEAHDRQLEACLRFDGDAFQLLAGLAANNTKSFFDAHRSTYERAVVKPSKQFVDGVLSGPVVASELSIPLKSANAALGELVAAGVLVEHGTMRPSGRGRPSRLYTSAELLGLTGSNPLRA